MNQDEPSKCEIDAARDVNNLQAERDQIRRALETLQHESKLFKRFREDVSEGMKCLPKCDSVAHEDGCPVANPVEAFRMLRQDNERLRGLLNEFSAGSLKMAQERDEACLALQESQQRYQRYEELLKTVGEYQVRELNLLSDLRESQQRVKELEDQLNPRTDLGHGMNCPGTVLGEEEACTCGLHWRVKLEASQQRVKELETENTRLKSVWTRSVVDIVKENNEQQTVIQELAEALREAKQTIRVYHGEPAWEIYERCSPEMKRFNAALASASPWLRKEKEINASWNGEDAE